jgi:hypothetical protein
MLLKIQISKTLLLSFPKWGQLNFEHFAAIPGPGDAPYDTDPIQPTDYIKDEYRSAARRQGGTTSGNYVRVSQATHPSLIHV